LEKKPLYTSTLSRKKFTTIEAATRLMSSMEVAINNMIDEIKKPVDPEINGSARKAELQSIKQTATDCKELLVERQRLEQMIKDLSSNGSIEETKDYSGGFAERYSK
jgi:cell shape-determining protein MreC